MAKATASERRHMARPLPEQSVLRRMFTYDAETGFLYWTGELRAVPAKYAGRQAFTGKTIRGYYRGGFVGRNVMAHRVVWKWHYGTEPDEIDHIDGNPSNNRIENLRAATRIENVRNTCIRKTTTSGVQGVYPKSGRWVATIRDGNRQLTLGSFSDLAAAAECRRQAEVRYGYHENHGRARNG